MLQRMTIQGMHQTPGLGGFAWSANDRTGIRWMASISATAVVRRNSTVTQPARHETDDGAWVYVPRFSARSASDPSPSPKSQHDAGSTHGSPHGTKQAVNPEPSDPPDWFYEGAESETPTHDTLVDPDGSSRSSRRRRARRAAGRQPSGTPEVATGSAVDNKEQSAHVGTSSSELPTVMRQLLSEKKDTKSKDSNSTSSWTSRKGPEPGIKWRGGTPPAPPTWKYNASDLRAFSRWERRVQMWQLQVKPYLSPSDAALTLFTSLTGEAEQEVEHLELERIHHKDGISYILDAVRGPLQQKELFQKRKLLADFESVGRMAHETVRQYINRYRRIEKDLESIGISSGAMYDNESRGNRILERTKLSPEFQRLVLIGAGNTMDYDRICESLLLQFPDFKPVPSIYVAGFQGSTSHSSSSSIWRQQNPHRGSARSSSSSSGSTTTSSSNSSSYSKGSGKRFPRK